MSGYIGPSPVPQSIQRRQTFTATAAQTTFGTTGYTDGDFIDVYLNGVKLVGGTDYTATNGTDVVLTTGAAAGDILDFVTFNSFQLNAPSFDNSLTLQNATEEDTDGGRESTIIFKGEQSGGEISTLAEIEASHDGTADDEKGDLIFRTNDGADGSAPTERLRIDSAGNVLVGKTSAGISAAGHSYRSDGTWEVRRDLGTANSSSVGYLSRGTTDGNILTFYKDTTAVGSISSRSSGGNLQINTNQSGIDFAGDGWLPMRGASIVDNDLDIGSSSFRFKDLYLSGGVYLGGTGSSNKLSDYDVGSWTPGITYGSTAGTMTNAYGAYTKVGRIVHCSGMLHVSSTNGGSDNAYLTGLPFTVADVVSNTSVEANGVIGYFANMGETVGTMTISAIANGTYCEIYKGTSASNATLASQNTLNSNSQIRFSISYVAA